MAGFCETPDLGSFCDFFIFLVPDGFVEAYFFSRACSRFLSLGFVENSRAATAVVALNVRRYEVVNVPGRLIDFAVAKMGVAMPSGDAGTDQTRITQNM